MDVFEFALFPFVDRASKYVETLDFSLNELFFDRVFQPIRERGKERVLEAVGEGIAQQSISDRTSAEKELLSYPVARILVSCTGDGYLIRRYALAEAEAAYDLIRNPPNFLKEPDDFRMLLKELIEDFTLDAVIDEMSVVMHFTDYIRYASSFHDTEWKLINRKIVHGRVYLSREKFLRILKEAIRRRIESSLPLEVPPEICTALNDSLAEIRDAVGVRKHEFSIEESREVMPSCFPPCMNHALSSVKAGVNLPHSMRFALTSFLLNIGMDGERVVEMFNVSPDFDEERTRYQVMHIHGATGTAYTSPSCSTMATYGNCMGKERLCDRISHPLAYYRKKTWLLKKGKIPENLNEKHTA